MCDIILDPNLNGCTVWTSKNVSTIKGYASEVCHEIYNRIMVPKQTPSGYEWIQVKTIGIDANMCGRAYLDLFENMNIEYTVIKPLVIDMALPKLS